MEQIILWIFFGFIVTAFVSAVIIKLVLLFKSSHNKREKSFNMQDYSSYIVVQNSADLIPDKDIEISEKKGFKPKC